MTDFEEIYNLYFKGVYKYAMSLCKNEAIAEEITQETFFKALKNIDSFDGKCKLYVWLFEIAKNTYFTLCKKEKRREALKNNLVSEDNLFENLLDKETANEIHKILHNLPEPYKEVFSLRAFGELSFSQIGKLFSKTESWARVTYYRAKLKIKEEL